MVQSVPVARSEVTVTDPDAAYELMRQTYTGVHVRSGGRQQGYRLSVRSLACGDFSVDEVQYPVRVQGHTEPFPREMFVNLRTGRLRVAANGGEYRWLPGDWGAYPSGAPIDFEIDMIGDQVVCLPSDVVRRAAAVLDDSGPARFTGFAPVSEQRCRLWDTTVEFVHHRLAAPDSPMAEPLVRERTLAMLAAAALATFPNTTMAHVYEPGPGQTGSRSLRKALAFIEANAHRPITITDIANAAGTSPRAVQYAFTRRLGTTPTLYLRRIRLQRAHQALAAADPTAGATVKAIAARWGFPNPGTFAVLHRRAYGTTPSHTLRT